MSEKKKKEYIIVIRKTLDFPVRIKAETQGEAMAIADGINLEELKNKPITERENIPKNKYASEAQDRSIHLYFKWLASALENLGLTPEEFFSDKLELHFTPTFIKESVWKPIQETLFGFTSTKRLKRVNHIDKIYDVINKHVSRWGINIPFPDKDLKRLEEMAQRMNIINNPKK